MDKQDSVCHFTVLDYVAMYMPNILTSEPKLFSTNQTTVMTYCIQGCVLAVRVVEKSPTRNDVNFHVLENKNMCVKRK